MRCLLHAAVLAWAVVGGQAAAQNRAEQGRAASEYQRDPNGVVHRETAQNAQRDAAQREAQWQLQASRGDGAAAYHLAWLRISQGEHLDGMTWLVASLRTGDLDARDLAVLMAKGECWRIGIHQAERFIYDFQDAARRDDAFGLTMMGLFWDLGFSPLQRNETLAVKHYERAVRAGSGWANVLLGDMYASGRVPGAPASPQQAARLWDDVSFSEPQAARRLLALYDTQPSWPDQVALPPARRRALQTVADKHDVEPAVECPLAKVLR